jgi:hypothetical protein
MRTATLLTTPPPTHAFVLDERGLAYACVDRGLVGFERTEFSPLDDGWCTLGPVGLLQVDRDRLRSALAGLLGRLDRRPTRASLVVPDAWIRSVVVDVGTLPRAREEAEEVVRWRLKKLLPCRPEEVRLDILPTSDEGRVAVVLGLDRPFGTVEDIFDEARVELGRVAPLAASLTALLPEEAGLQLVVAIAESSLALVVVAQRDILLLRHKGMPTDERGVPLLQRELAQTVDWARQHGADGGALHLWLASRSQAGSAAVAEWALAHPEVTIQEFGLQAAAGAGVDRLQQLALLSTVRERVS